MLILSINCEFTCLPWLCHVADIIKKRLKFLQLHFILEGVREGTETDSKARTQGIYT